MGFPRRNMINEMTPAELSIYNATQEVEKIGADVKLTEAIVLLTKARELVADFLDASHPKANTAIADFISGATDAGFDD